MDIVSTTTRWIVRIDGNLDVFLSYSICNDRCNFPTVLEDFPLCLSCFSQRLRHLVNVREDSTESLRKME